MAEHTHIVKEGDTLSNISEYYYRDMEYSSLLVIRNHIKNPDLLSIGQKIKIPTFLVTSSELKEDGNSILSFVRVSTCKVKQEQIASATEVTIAIGEIPSYHGDFPSPFPLMWYVPDNAKEILKIHYEPKEIRKWVSDAAKFHEIPYLLLATILQQENCPNATYIQKVLQFGERTLTTGLRIADNLTRNRIPDSIELNGKRYNITAGSSGIANMSHAALIDGVKHANEVYSREPMPDSVKYRIGGYNQDTRISGDDLRADLYYAAAHLRHIIDRVMKHNKFYGLLSLEDFEKICAAYNGPAGQKYGREARIRLEKARDGIEPLYFYEK
jgi:LysM repeat protein